MSRRPRLLDLFCGAGGAARGYQSAGFHVTGVDNQPQKRYVGDRFILGDALDYCREHGHEFDAVHASPPCQAYSAMRCLPWLRDREYPELIDPTREALEATGLPWVIENVERAPLRNGITLCGTMFGLKVYRHRKFESNILLLASPHAKHPYVIGHGRMLNDRAAPNEHGYVCVVGKSGRNRNIGSYAEPLMGIDWMTGAELSQAVPPSYTKLVGTQLWGVLADRRGG